MGAESGFGIYVHWPFCLSKCPYCDFNSHVSDTVDDGRWRRALVNEIDYFARQTPGRTVGSIFFGGGTPSLMAPATVTAVIEKIARSWPLEDDIEITLEANPTSVEAARFEAYRAAGVNRLSLGIQALDDDALKFLGRGHSAAQALGALETARAHFDSFSFDLIYARPGQDARSWSGELSRALALAGGHLSLYQLTVEKGTPFYARWRRGEIAMPDGDDAALLFDQTRELCRAAGLRRYEISNYAAPGHESRHNLTYWRYGDYAGIGPGAHGRLPLGPDGGRHALSQIRDPGAWLASVEARGHGSDQCERLAISDQAMEMIMMGLRLEDGLSRDRFARIIGRPIEHFISADGLSDMVAGGLMTSDSAVIAVTAEGAVLLDAILARLTGEGA